MTDETTTDAGHAARPRAPVPSTHLFLVIEAARPLAGGARSSLSQIDEVILGRGPRREVRREIVGGVRRLDVRIPDRRMSEVHARLVRDGQHFVFEDAGSKNGSRLNGDRWERPVVLRDGDLIEVGHTLLRLRDALPTPFGTPADIDDAQLRDVPDAFVSLMPTVAADARLIARVAPSRVSVLLLGETGTGKEVLARAIHHSSLRSGPFVAVNCGALAPTLTEAQLFGHVRGAFSGAVRDEPGFVRASHGGTLFLDEIGDLPKPSQATLLRVLQEQEVVPVGSAKALKVDLRVIAATHEDLSGMITRKDFRADLFARIAGFSQTLTPLRERVEDLGLLIARTLPRVAPDSVDAIQLAPETVRALVAHAWPLNVRELVQCLGVSVVLATEGLLAPEHLPPPLRSAAHSSSARVPPKDDAAVQQALLRALAEHKGNVSEVARAMGKARMQIQRWLRRFGIDPRTFRP
jgi:DNA-binding NtrC family response regulator